MPKVMMQHPDLIDHEPVEVDARAFEKVWEPQGWIRADRENPYSVENEEGTGDTPAEPEDQEPEGGGDVVAEGSDGVVDEEDPTEG